MSVSTPSASVGLGHVTSVSPRPRKSDERRPKATSKGAASTLMSALSSASTLLSKVASLRNQKSETVKIDQLLKTLPSPTTSTKLSTQHIHAGVSPAALKDTFRKYMSYYYYSKQLPIVHALGRNQGIQKSQWPLFVRPAQWKHSGKTISLPAPPTALSVVSSIHRPLKMLAAPPTVSTRWHPHQNMFNSALKRSNAPFLRRPPHSKTSLILARPPAQRARSHTRGSTPYARSAIGGGTLAAITALASRKRKKRSNTRLAQKTNARAQTKIKAATSRTQTHKLTASQTREPWTRNKAMRKLVNWSALEKRVLELPFPRAPITFPTVPWSTPAAPPATVVTSSKEHSKQPMAARPARPLPMMNRLMLLQLPKAVKDLPSPPKARAFQNEDIMKDADKSVLDATQTRRNLNNTRRLEWRIWELQGLKPKTLEEKYARAFKGKTCRIQGGVHLWKSIRKIMPGACVTLIEIDSYGYSEYSWFHYAVWKERARQSKCKCLFTSILDNAKKHMCGIYHALDSNSAYYINTADAGDTSEKELILWLRDRVIGHEFTLLNTTPLQDIGDDFCQLHTIAIAYRLYHLHGTMKNGSNLSAAYYAYVRKIYKDRSAQPVLSNMMNRLHAYDTHQRGEPKVIPSMILLGEKYTSTFARQLRSFIQSLIQRKKKGGYTNISSVIKSPWQGDERPDRVYVKSDGGIVSAALHFEHVFSRVPHIKYLCDFHFDLGNFSMRKERVYSDARERPNVRERLFGAPKSKPPPPPSGPAKEISSYMSRLSKSRQASNAEAKEIARHMSRLSESNVANGASAIASHFATVHAPSVIMPTAHERSSDSRTSELKV